MTPEQYQQFTDNIKETIKTTVNGKIDRIEKKLDTYIEEDNKWKAAAQPTIDMGNNVRGFNKVLMYILGIGAALYAFINIFKK